MIGGSRLRRGRAGGFGLRRGRRLGGRHDLGLGHDELGRLRRRLVRRGQRQQLGDAGEVGPEDLERRRRVQRRGRVVERVEPHVSRPDLPDLLAPVQARDTGAGVGAQQLGREVAERADHARLDQLELAE